MGHRDRIHKTMLFVLAISIMGIFWNRPLSAQFTTASLDGMVLDASGGTVPDAQVAVENTDTGFKQTVETGPTGAFLFPRLPVGNYRLTVEKPGFFKYVQDGITLTVSQAASQVVTLRVGEVTQAVTVDANAELVTTSTSTVGQLIDTRRILDLPLNGRQAQSLVLLSVGTADVTNQNCGFNCNGGVYPGEQYASSSGGGPNGINYQMDGISHNDSYLNINLPFPNPDAVQEFNVQAYNMSAQYGNAVSSVVNVVTKSGTNQLHGDVFEFLRNGALNARNFFAPKQDSLKRNQFGGSIGGPIKKDKLFFFGTYQGTRVRTAAEGVIQFVPTQAERNGDFSDLLPGKQLVDPVTGAPFLNNQIPTGRFSPVSEKLLESIPLPNGPGRQLTFLGSRIHTNDDQFMVKIDFAQGKHQISGRYFFSNFQQPPQTEKTNLLASDSSANRVRVQTVSVNWTYTRSPTLLFNTVFGSIRQFGGSLSSAPFSFSDLGVNIAATTPPELSLGVGGAFSINTGHPGDFNRANPWTAGEDVTVVKGKHELHLGGEAVRTISPIANTFWQNGSFSFSNSLSGDNLADFLLGRVSSFVQDGGIYGDVHGTNVSLYAQDNWKVNARLNFQFGLRWDPYVPLKDTKGRITCREPGNTTISRRYPNSPPGLLFAGDPDCPEGASDNNLGNFAPRLGFAYRLTSDGKTSLRGGAGFYYQRPQTVLYQDVEGVAPFAPALFLNDTDFADPFGSAGVANPFPEAFGPSVPGPDAAFPLPVSIFAVISRHFRSPQTITWNLTLERQLGSSWVFRAGYVGTKGTYLFGESSQKSLTESNPAIFRPGATIGNTQERRIDPNFGPVGYVASGNNSNYHALQLNLEKRFGLGFSLLTNYTWSKQLDDFGGGYLQTNPFIRAFDHGRSNEDLSGIWKLSGIWNIPSFHMKTSSLIDKLFNGWVVATSTVWRGGFPVTIFSGLDNSFSGVGFDRVDLLTNDVGSLSLSSDRPHGELVNQFFNTSVVGPNAEGTFGNAGKNILRGPRFFNVDIGIIKRTKISERLSIEFRSEFFNAFNSVNFNKPDATFTDNGFGQLTSAQDPRIIQFGLKLLF